MDGVSEGSGKYPLTLQHRDARRQGLTFAIFAAVLVVLPAATFVAHSAGRFWMLALLLPALVAGYAAVRLFSLKVVLDSTGLREPQPLGRPTIVTPWPDVVRIRRTEDSGAMKLRFLGVAIEHNGGWKHQVLALNVNTRDPLADKTISEWIAAIRDARAEFGGK